MKKLINIPDNLFSHIQANAKLFGWSCQSEIVEMLYCGLAAREKYLSSRLRLRSISSVRSDIEDDSSALDQMLSQISCE